MLQIWNFYVSSPNPSIGKKEEMAEPSLPTVNHHPSLMTTSYTNQSEGKKSQPWCQSSCEEFYQN